MNDPESKKEYIAYRIERAWKTFDDANALIGIQSWNSAINRLYYSSFYAVLALFAKFEINTQTHSGVKNQFSMNFIKTGKLDKTYGILFSDLFNYRQQGDYDDFFDFEESDVRELIPQVEQFLTQIETLIGE